MQCPIDEDSHMPAAWLIKILLRFLSPSLFSLLSPSSSLGSPPFFKACQLGPRPSHGTASRNDRHKPLVSAIGVAIAIAGKRHTNGHGYCSRELQLHTLPCPQELPYLEPPTATTTTVTLSAPAAAAGTAMATAVVGATAAVAATPMVTAPKP